MNALLLRLSIARDCSTLFFFEVAHLIPSFTLSSFPVIGTPNRGFRPASVLSHSLNGPSSFFSKIKVGHISTITSGKSLPLQATDPAGSKK